MSTQTTNKHKACVAGGVKTGILETHMIVCLTYKHTDGWQTRSLRRWWCKNRYTRHTRLCDQRINTLTIGTQEACVAGGVKTGILDTHDSVANV